MRTASGAVAVQVVWSSPRGSREIDHLGSAHDEAGLATLKTAGRQRIAAGQAELDLGFAPAGGGPLPITFSRMGCLLDALERGYRVLGFDAAGGDSVFRDLVAGQDHRAGQQARQPAGSRGGRDYAGFLPDRRARPASICCAVAVASTSN